MGDWKPLPLAQPRRGYRYSVDALLLAGFTLAFSPRRWLDIGTGCGVIAFYLGRCLPASRGVAVERQPQLAAFARQNLADRSVLVVQGDARTFPWRAHAFDLLVCNPPFYLPGHGKIKKDPVAAHARHAFFGTFDDFLTALQPALTPAGRVCGVLPADVYARLSPGWEQAGWFPDAVLRVASFADRPAGLVCFSLVRGQPVTPASRDLVLYRAHRVYTDAATAFFARLTRD
ncbi:tRNA1(Val) (adenine(37)-N6)-methyltransferase [Acanthopleuribacter pedis]|uniref:Methyltransferase n=1 Tax=Acanthopleuribacter pedis TaxID=442870 RepID=A0A8J7QCQ7_9BACT|nr:methyltransferase domain-containing protein [Acanthopleuribacter pedis]MBO1317165.1 methyltransferase [Acanthopleuribacter pedis]